MAWQCDGQRPCSSCSSRRVTNCVYEVPTRMSKENMRRDIEQLQDKVHTMERIINALTINEDSDHVIQQLRNKISLEKISGQLENTFPAAQEPPISTATGDIVGNRPGTILALATGVLEIAPS